MTTHITTECKTQDGITAGLFDAINTISQLVVLRDLDAPEVVEAMKDLKEDHAFQALQFVMSTL